jgi:hypothetical protein
MRKVTILVGLAALAVAPSAYALEGAGAHPGSFGIIPAIFDDGSTVFTVMKMNNVGNGGRTLHYYFIRTSDWSINNKCIYLSGFDFDWFVFSQLVVGLLEFDYSQGGMSYFATVNTPQASGSGNSKYGDPNGVACGGTLQDWDWIKGEEFVIDVPANTSWQIPIVTYEGNDGYDGVADGAIGADDGLYSYAPFGNISLAELIINGILAPPKYFANYPNIFYIEFLPQSIVTTEQVCVPNAFNVFGILGGWWASEFLGNGAFFYDIYDVRSWNDLEEPLPSVQQAFCTCWAVDTITNISQLDLANVFAKDGGWTRLTSYYEFYYGGIDFFEGPGTIQITLETVGGTFRQGSDWSSAYYTHHERTTTETVLDQCDFFADGFFCAVF